MADVGSIFVKFGSDTSGFTKGNREVQSGLDRTGKSATQLGGVMKGLGTAMAGAFSVGMVINLGKEMIAVTGQFQKYAAVLTTTLGSSKDAAAAMGMLKKFAADTPFQLGELTNSYVKLVNRGIKPTSVDMRSLGDLASSTGKSFDQLAEAMLDAMTGQNERLKEVGVTARDMGDKTAYTFKGVTTEVDKTSTAIADYLIGLGKMEGVTGSMAAISKTLTGQISNMQDAWDGLLVSMGNRTTGIISNVIKLITTLYEKLTLVNNLASGQFGKDYATKIEADGKAFASTAKNVEDYKTAIIAFIQERKKLQTQFDEDVNKQKSEQSKLGNKLAVGGHSYWESMVKGAEQSAQANRDAVESLTAYLGNEKELAKVFEKKVPIVVKTSEKIKDQTGAIGQLNIQIKLNQDLIEGSKAKTQEQITAIYSKIKALEAERKQLMDIAELESNKPGTLTKMSSRGISKVTAKTATKPGELVGIQESNIKTISDAEDKLSQNRDEAHNERLRQIKQEGKVAIDFNNLIRDAAVQGFSTIGESIGQLFAGEITVRGFFNNILLMVGDFMKKFGEAMVAAAAAKMEFDATLGFSGPLALAAGIGLIAAGAYVQSLAKKGMKSYEAGGVFRSPTIGMFGEYPSARSNPEVAGKLSDLKQIFGGGSVNGKLYIEGRDLVYVFGQELNRQNRM